MKKKVKATRKKKAVKKAVGGRKKVVKRGGALSSSVTISDLEKLLHKGKKPKADKMKQIYLTPVEHKEGEVIRLDEKYEKLDRKRANRNIQSRLEQNSSSLPIPPPPLMRLINPITTPSPPRRRRNQSIPSTPQSGSRRRSQTPRLSFTPGTPSQIVNISNLAGLKHAELMKLVEERGMDAGSKTGVKYKTKSQLIKMLQ